MVRFDAGRRSRIQEVEKDFLKSTSIAMVSREGVTLLGGYKKELEPVGKACTVFPYSTAFGGTLTMQDDVEPDQLDRGYSLLGLKSYDDLLARTKFVRDVKDDGRKLVEILDEYRFPIKVQCGFTNCHTWHNWGLLAQLENGDEINIGNVCGARHFPEHFDRELKRFTGIRDQQFRENAFERYKNQANELSALADSIWSEERGAYWANECERQVRESAPQCLLNLRPAIAAGRYALTVAKRRDEESAGLGFKKSDAFEDVQVGLLKGARALFNTPAPLLRRVRDVIGRGEVEVFATLDARVQRMRLNEFVKARGVLDQASDLVKDARQCYTRANLEQLHRIAARERDAIEFLIKQIEAVPSTYVKRAS